VRIGASFHKRRQNLEGEWADLDVIESAILTLLGLIVGFSFSMAVNRYDQRKIAEAAEANAIGAEYLRADLLPAADASQVLALQQSYIGQRILFYQTRDDIQLRQIDSTTALLETELWSAVQASAAAEPTPVAALAVSGMNDVLNSEGYTQAAWWNRMPVSTWVLMTAIALCCNLLIGYGARRPNARGILFFALPLVVSVSFFLIADIDSPRGGLIRVRPQNLVSVSESFQHQPPRNRQELSRN
jgi:hypothetical protein